MKNKLIALGSLRWHEVIDESFCLRSQSFNVLTCCKFIVLKLERWGAGYTNERIMQFRVSSGSLDKYTSIFSKGFNVAGQEGPEPYVWRNCVLWSLALSQVRTNDSRLDLSIIMHLKYLNEWMI